MHILFVWWIVLIPFIVLYGAYEGPKVWWLWSGGFVLTAWWLYRIVIGKSVTISSQGKWFLVWIAVLAVSSMFGVHPWASIIGGSYRHQGVLFFITLLFISETLPLLFPQAKKLLIACIGWGVVLESIIVIAQKLDAWNLRPSGTLGEPNAAAGFLAVGLFWVRKLDKLPAWFRSICSLLVLVAIVTTQSRIGIVAALILSAGFGLRILIQQKHSAYVVGFVLGGIVSVVVAGLVFVRVISIIRPQSQYENRLVFWRIAIAEIAKRPLVGYGAESGEVVYDRAFAKNNVRLVDFMIDRTHNLILDVAMWSGITGLIVFAGWIITMFRQLIASGNYLSVAAFVAWLAYAFVQPLSVVHWVQLMLLSQEYDLPVSSRGGK